MSSANPIDTGTFKALQDNAFLAVALKEFRHE